MTNLVTIIEYEATDKQDVIHLIRSNTPEYFAPEEEAELSDYLDSERERYYVMTYDGKIVGCGGINFENNHTIGIISRDILHPSYQGRGLGRKLLKYRIKELNAMASIHKIIVRTSQLTNKFYEKLGFELLEIKKDYWAKGFDLYYMEYKKPL